MTNKPMLSVERELLEVYTGRKEGDWVEAGHELRAILANQPPCAKSQVEPAAQHQGEPVAICRLWNEGGSGERTTVEFIKEPCADGTLLYAEQPAPVAVVMPDDWEDQLFAEMSRRFNLRKMIDDDHMVYDDTQIGVEFAIEWVKARLNGVKP